MLAAHHVSKSFDGVEVLDRVSIGIEAGEVHALMGENGAGKSTLMKILAGQLKPSAGTVSGGERVAMIHQELLPFPDLSVAENILIGREPAGRFPGTVDRRALNAEASRVLARVGLDVNPESPMRGLSVAAMQLVEIGKALVRDANVILMDEPTSALAAHETELLFAIIRDLTARGVAVVYTSHKLDEVMRIARRITVLRDGRHVATTAATDLDEAKLIELMVGRGVAPHAGERRARAELVLECGPLRLHRGEIVALAGLMGAGRTEFAREIYGLVPGRPVQVGGTASVMRHPADALRHGIAMVTDDRKASGIIPRLPVAANLTLSSLKHRVLRREIVEGELQRLGVKARSPQQEIATLSGGNQQKVLIGRALRTNPTVLILDEPTRGIDIAAKADVHRQIRELAREGKAILLVSSEIPEILALADRILVMRGGSVVGELDARSATEQQILAYALPEAAAC